MCKITYAHTAMDELNYLELLLSTAKTNNDYRHILKTCHSVICNFLKYIVDIKAPSIAESIKYTSTTDTSLERLVLYLNKCVGVNVNVDIEFLSQAQFDFSTPCARYVNVSYDDVRYGVDIVNAFCAWLLDELDLILLSQMWEALMSDKLDEEGYTRMKIRETIDIHKLQYPRIGVT